MSAAVRQAVRGMLGDVIVRGKVVSARVEKGRTFLQVTGLGKDVRDGVELLMPFGMSGVPKPGADVALLTIAGTRDHHVALMADWRPSRVPGLGEGDAGLSGDGVRVVALRNGRIEIIALGEVLRQLVTDAFLPLFNAHTHPTPAGESGPPNTPMTADHLTVSLHAGGR